MDNIEQQKAAAIVTKSVAIIDDINTLDSVEEWCDRMLHLFDWFNQVHSGMELATYYALSFIQDRWDDFPFAFRQDYDLDFMVFAARRLNKQVATIEKNLRTARTFLREPKVSLTMTVTVPKRHDGQPVVDEKGRLVTENRIWNPLETSLSKLNVVRSAAEAGKLSPLLAAMVMDEGVTVPELQATLYSPAENGITETGKGESSPDLRFGLNGNVLTASRFGQTIEIGELYMEVYEIDAVAKDGIDRLLRFLGIKVSDIENRAKTKFGAVLTAYGLDYDSIVEADETNAAAELILSQRREQ